MSAMSSATRQDVLGSRCTAPREWPARLTRASELARHIDAATLAGALMLEAQARLIVGQLDQVAPVLAKAERIGLPVEAVLLDRRMTIYADLSMALGRTREALERYAQSLEYAQAAGNELQVVFDCVEWPSCSVCCARTRRSWRSWAWPRPTSASWEARARV